MRALHYLPVDGEEDHVVCGVRGVSRGPLLPPEHGQVSHVVQSDVLPRTSHRQTSHVCKM